MGKLLFIGSTCADVLVRIPCLPVTGDDIHIRQQSISLGGCAFNAYRAARLFHSACDLFSPVGSGLWGDWVHSALEKEGIVSLIPRVEDANGCCYCLVEADGERTFLCEHGAEYRFQPNWFDTVDLTGYEGVYLCGLEAEEPSGTCILDALESEPPKQLYFAPGPRICRIPPDRMARIMAMRPVFHLNEAEAEQFTRQETPEDAARLIRSFTRADVIITQGERGALVLTDEGFLHTGAPAVTVTDTIGAGDAHIGAYMGALAAGQSRYEALGTACRLSAAVVTVEGAGITPAQWQKIQKEI